MGKEGVSGEGKGRREKEGLTGAGKGMRGKEGVSGERKGRMGMGVMYTSSSPHTARLPWFSVV